MQSPDDPVSSVHDYLVLPDDVDLTNCDREAIHVPGAVQSHGALLAVDDSGRVVIASRNAGEILRDDDPRGSKVLDVVRDVRSPGLAEWLDQSGSNRRLQSVVARDGRIMDAIAHRMQGLLLVELEPTDGDTSASEALVDDIAEASTALMSAQSLADSHQTATEVVRRLTGFERVMVYMFDHEGHGEVVAEDLAPGVESFLGLRYPATDIPRQARALYVRNWTRLIVDSAAQPSPLQPRTVPGTDEPLNLAMAQLRAVSPIHLEYLRNMGVTSSFSLSLVRERELVGLVACHSSRRQHVPFAVRAACELLARLLSEQLARTATRQRQRLDRRRQRLQLEALQAFSGADRPAEALASLAEVTVGPMDATGFMGRHGGASHEEGEVPLDTAEVQGLLRSHEGDPVVAVERLQDQGVQGGVLVARTRRGSDEDFLAWFRPSVTRTVTWGGDPTESLAKTEDLTPRASFEAWTEMVRHRCQPWEEFERRLAMALHQALAAGSAGIGEGAQAPGLVEGLFSYIQQLEASNTELRRAGEEREALLAAVGHDLRSPLQTIRGFVHLLTQKTTAVREPLAIEAATRIVQGTERMSELLDGLQRWSRLGDVITPTPVDLLQTLETVLESLRALLDEGGAAVDVGPLPAVSGDPLLLRQLFQNLVENAVKYRHPDRPPLIVVSARRLDGNAIVTVADNGLGIDAAALEEVFGLFQQLRPGEDQGIGLGLALVARIAQRHGGEVWAESTPGQGSAFHVRLPLAEA